MMDHDLMAKDRSLEEIGLDGFAPYLMNRIMGRYNNGLREDMARLGLTTPQVRSLAVLSIHDGILIRELAIYTVTDQSTLSRALDTLEQNGKIRRQSDDKDNRGVRIFLTEQGRAAFAQLWPTMANNAERMFAGVPASERAEFVATLQKVLENVRRHEF